MADIFVSRMRKLCNSMSEAIYLAAENEKQAREVCTNANELTTDVEIVSFSAQIPRDHIIWTILRDHMDHIKGSYGPY